MSTRSQEVFRGRRRRDTKLDRCGALHKDRAPGSFRSFQHGPVPQQRRGIDATRNPARLFFSRSINKRRSGRRTRCCGLPTPTGPHPAYVPSAPPREAKHEPLGFPRMEACRLLQRLPFRGPTTSFIAMEAAIRCGRRSTRGTGQGCLADRSFQAAWTSSNSAYHSAPYLRMRASFRKRNTGTSSFLPQLHAGLQMGQRW